MNGGYFKLINTYDNSLMNRYLNANNKLTNRLHEIKKKKEIKNKYNKEIIINEINKLIILIKDKNINDNDNILNNKKIKFLQNKLNILNNENLYPDSNDIEDSHLFFINSYYKPFVTIGYEYSQTTVNTQPLLGGTCTFKIPKYGEFLSDMVVYIKLSKLQPKNPLNKVKYCNFLGHKLLEKVDFEVDNDILDEYTSEEYNFHYNYNILPNKKDAWKSCIGQELPFDGYLTQDPKNQDFRELKKIYNGNQTLKQYHDSIELFIPLLFWFCDPKLALPNLSLPFGKTFINLKLASINDIAAYVDYENTNDGFITPIIEQCVLYINHIYIPPDIYDIYIRKIGFSLIRVHKRQEIILNISNDNILLNELRWPVEQIYLSFRPINNINGPDKMVTWNNNNNITLNQVDYPTISQSGNISIITNTKAIYYDENPIINTLGLSTQNIDLYQKFPSMFYHSYLPYNYGKYELNTNKGNGSYMLNFNFYPNQYQPSGYLNITNIRDLYLYYDSNFISNTNEVKLFIYAKTMNFLFVSKKQIELKFIL